MSDRESSDRAERPVYGGAEFTRESGLLSLSLGWLLPPVVALVNQQLIYSVNMWACGRNMHATMHIVPFLSLVVTIATAIAAHRNWKRAGAGVEMEAGGVLTRSRFLAFGGIVIAVFSSLVVAAQWLAIFVFDPCMRA
jgi:hypothetical protein